MKLAQLNFARGYYIPGLGERVMLTDVEVEQQEHGMLVTTPTAKVLVPWGCIAPSVTEWVSSRPTPEVERAIVAGALPAAAIGASEPVVASGPLLQPPPSQKKGGRR